MFMFTSFTCFSASDYSFFIPWPKKGPMQYGKSPWNLLRDTTGMGIAKRRPICPQSQPEQPEGQWRNGRQSLNNQGNDVTPITRWTHVCVSVLAYVPLKGLRGVFLTFPKKIIETVENCVLKTFQSSFCYILKYKNILHLVYALKYKAHC